MAGQQSSTFSSLGNRDFRWLWTGSLASSFAMNMQIVARGWLVYTLTSSPLDLGWVTLAFMLPQVVFSLWGGVLADRAAKRRIIAVAQSLNFVATMVMAVIIFTGRVTFWDFIWFGFFNGTVLALSMPSRQAFVPELVGDALVFNAMALNTASWNLARIIGPAFAGVLIALVAQGDTSSTYGVGIVFFMIAALYFVSAASVSMIRYRSRTHHQARERRAVADIADGLTYVWRTPPVFGLILLSLAPFLFGIPINTLLPAFTHDVLAGGAEDLGFLIGAMGVGAIIGSLMLARLGHLANKGSWIVAGCLVWGVTMAVFAVSTTMAVAALLIALIGWVSAWNMSLNRGLLQIIAEPDMRGRIMSIDMMSRGLMPLGVLPITYIAETVSIPAALITAGAVFVVVTLLLSRMPSVRDINGAETAADTERAATSELTPPEAIDSTPGG